MNKKYFNLIFSALFLAAMSFVMTACGDDDDEPENPGNSTTNSELVGKWDIDVTTTAYTTSIPEAQDYYNHEETEYGNGAYWEFTASKVTVHDPNDLANNTAAKYTYDKSKRTITIGGSLVYKVEKLTDDEMRLKNVTSDGNFSITTTIEFTKD